MVFEDVGMMLFVVDVVVWFDDVYCDVVMVFCLLFNVMFLCLVWWVCVMLINCDSEMCLLVLVICDVCVDWVDFYVEWYGCWLFDYSFLVDCGDVCEVLLCYLIFDVMLYVGE